MANNKSLLINASSKSAHNTAIVNGTISKDSIAFIKEAGNECIYAKGNYYKTIPSGGSNGQVLKYKDNKAVWETPDEVVNAWYGIEFSAFYSNVRKIGNKHLLKTLPIQSGMKGCIYDAVDNTVIYWLDDNDWRYIKGGGKKIVVGDFNGIYSGDNLIILMRDRGKEILIPWLPSFSEDAHVSDKAYSDFYVKANGVLCNVLANSILDPDSGMSLIILKVVNDGEQVEVANNYITIEQCACLNGYDGEVMVYVPEFYITSSNDNSYRQIKVSQYPFDDSWEYQPAVYVSAYKCTVSDWSKLDYSENFGYISKIHKNSADKDDLIALSIVNKGAFCLGGSDVNSESALNSECSANNMRGKCRTGVSRKDFRVYSRNGKKEIMSYLQYKNILCWLYLIEVGAIQNTLVQHDYVGNVWNLIGKNPILPNGVTNNLGNGTGTSTFTDITIDYNGDSMSFTKFSINRWRGIENLYGHISQMCDGIWCRTTVVDGLPYAKPIIFENPKGYTDDNTGEYVERAYESVLVPLSDDNGVVKKTIKSVSLTPMSGPNFVFKSDIIPTSFLGNPDAIYPVLIGSDGNTDFIAPMFGGTCDINTINAHVLSQEYSVPGDTDSPKPYCGFRTVHLA